MKPRIHEGIHGCCSVSPEEICAPLATQNSRLISALIPPGLAPEVRRSGDCYWPVTQGSSADGAIHTNRWHRKHTAKLPIPTEKAEEYQ